MIENYKQAATAYRDTYVSNMSNFDIVVELYKGILKNVRQAKSAYQADKLDEMCGFVEKANRILIALQSHLDFDNGGEASVFLNNFYNGIFSSLSSVLRTTNPEETFDRILENIQPIYEIWCKHAYIKPQAGEAPDGSGKDIADK
jgi:flagellar biosynthetic protein FliS